MLKMNTTNATLRNLIEDLHAQLVKMGSYIHPDIEIIENEGQVSLHLLNTSSDTPLFKIPHAALIPYDLFDLDINGDKIVMDSHHSGATEEQIKIFETIIALYNVTDKISLHKQTHPWFAFNEHKDILDLLFSAREGRDIDIIQSHIHNPDFYNELVLLTFFKSRLVSCALNKKDSEPQYVVPPLIEFMNHHPQGAGFDMLYHPDASFMQIDAKTPIANNTECFTSYGRFDAMDSYLHYGYVNEDAKFLRSIPLHLNILGLGDFTIRSLDLPVHKSDIPDSLKGLDFYMPRITIDHEKKSAELSHLFIPHENARYSLRRILEYTLSLLAADMPEEKRFAYIGLIENEVMQANSDFFSKLNYQIEKKKAKKAPKNSIKLISKIASTHIEKYKNIIETIT